jgi:DNA-binding GntR family transcriptional regulator
MALQARSTGKPRRLTSRSTGHGKGNGKVRHLSLRDQAYEAIKHRIITCAYKPGEYINEYQISDELGFGRTPVHQAVTLLQTQGLLAVIPRKGTIVKPVSLDEILQVAEVRIVNEMECVRLAAQRITPEEIVGLERILEQSDKARLARNIEKLMLLDRDFHDALARAARNPVLADILRTLHERSLRVWFISLNDPAHLQRVHSEHELIVTSLKRRDAEAAVSAMNAHIISYRANISRAV